MRKLLFIAIIIATCFTTNTFGQFVKTPNGLVDLRELPVTYVQIVAQGKFLSYKVNIELDFGQKPLNTNSGIGMLINDKGAKLNFNSPIHAINYMASYGWEYLDAYTLTSGNSNIYYYTFINREKKLNPGDVVPIEEQ